MDTYEPTKRIMPDDGVYSDWELATEIAADYGLESDYWQQMLIRDILMERENGLYAAPIFGFSLPRRSGKSHLIRILALYFMTVLNRDVVYTAHMSLSAQEVFKEMKILFEETELSAHVKKIVNITGHEGIYLNEGGSFRVFSRSSKGGTGRGSAAQVLFLDEAYSLPAGTLADLLPMTSNAENPLVVYLGSPSYEDTDGIAFKNLRESAITGHNPRAGWVEWAAGEGEDIYDPAVWAKTNPAYPHRISPETMSNNVYSGMSRRQILTELMGSWEAENRPLIVDLDLWNKMGDPASRISPDSELVLAADAAPDESSATLLVAGFRPDGIKHIEVIEQLPGMKWVEERIKAACKKRTYRAVLIDSKSPLAYMAESLQKDGVPVVLTNYEYMANSAVNFKQGVEAMSFRHLGDGRLTRSIRDAATRPLNGRFAFTKAESSSDITAVVAASLALFGLGSDAATSKLKKQKTGKVYVGGKLYERNS